MIVAMDGPAGSGKSSVAKEVARVLGFHYLDTGAMFRSIAYKALSEGVDLSCKATLANMAVVTDIAFSYGPGDVLPSHVLVDGVDVTEAIRKPEVDKAVSPVASNEGVRAALLEAQRQIASHDDYVVEGRDIGTVVFPDAEVKVFVTATAHERAARRAKQNIERGMSGDIDEIYEALLARDKADSEREVAPLVAADDALVLDTTGMTMEQVVDTIVSLVRGEDGV